MHGVVHDGESVDHAGGRCRDVVVFETTALDAHADRRMLRRTTRSTRFESQFAAGEERGVVIVERRQRPVIREVAGRGFGHRQLHTNFENRTALDGGVPGPATDRLNSASAT